MFSQGSFLCRGNVTNFCYGSDTTFWRFLLQILFVHIYSNDDNCDLYILSNIQAIQIIMNYLIRQNKKNNTMDIRICVIGLGYVGLPLARLFSTKYETIGFDMNQQRVNSLMNGHDVTLEVSDEALRTAIEKGFKCTTDIEDIKNYNFYIFQVLN